MIYRLLISFEKEIIWKHATILKMKAVGTPRKQEKGKENFSRWAGKDFI